MNIMLSFEGSIAYTALSGKFMAQGRQLSPTHAPKSMMFCWWGTRPWRKMKSMTRRNQTSWKLGSENSMVLCLNCKLFMSFTCTLLSYSKIVVSLDHEIHFPCAANKRCKERNVRTRMMHTPSITVASNICDAENVPNTIHPVLAKNSHLSRSVDMIKIIFD